MRVLLTIGLVAPAAFLFIQLGDYIDTKLAAASRELLGVEYLSALGPVAAALGEAQSAAVSGGSIDAAPSGAALTTAVERMAAVDERIGGELGLRERWLAVRTRIEALPRTGDSRTAYALYTSYGDVSRLIGTLFDRAGQHSGLSVDVDTDVYYLHQAVTTDLPRLTAATGRFADLALLNRGATVGVRDLADLFQSQREGADAANRLIDAIETASSTTVNGNLIKAVYSPLDAVRADLDRLTEASSRLEDTELSEADVSAITTLRGNLASAATQLSAAILGQLAILLTDRRDAAGQQRLFAVGGLAALVLLALSPTIAGLRATARRRRDRAVGERLEAAPPMDSGPQWTRMPATGAEPARVPR